VCQQLKEFADRHRTGQPQNGGPAMQVNAAAGPSSIPISQPNPQPQPISQGTTQPGFKTGPEPVLGADTSNSQNVYPISATLNTTNPGPVQWASAQQGRPTLTGGIAGGRMSGSCVYEVIVILHLLIYPRRDSGSGCTRAR